MMKHTAGRWQAFLQGRSNVRDQISAAGRDELGATLRLSDFLPYRLSVLSNTVSRGIADRYQRDFGLSFGSGG